MIIICLYGGLSHTSTPLLISPPTVREPTNSTQSVTHKLDEIVDTFHRFPKVILSLQSVRLFYSSSNNDQPIQIEEENSSTLGGQTKLSSHKDTSI